MMMITRVIMIMKKTMDNAMSILIILKMKNYFLIIWKKSKERKIYFNQYDNTLNVVLIFSLLIFIIFKLNYLFKNHYYLYI